MGMNGAKPPGRTHFTRKQQYPILRTRFPNSQREAKEPRKHSQMHNMNLQKPQTKGAKKNGVVAQVSRSNQPTDQSMRPWIRLLVQSEGQNLSPFPTNNEHRPTKPAQASRRAKQPLQTRIQTVDNHCSAPLFFVRRFHYASLRVQANPSPKHTS